MLMIDIVDKLNIWHVHTVQQQTTEIVSCDFMYYANLVTNTQMTKKNADNTATCIWAIFAILGLKDRRSECCRSFY